MRRGPIVKINSARLREELGWRGISQIGLALEIGTQEECVSRLISRGRCRSETLESIEEALHLPKNTLLVLDPGDQLPTDNKPRYYRLKAQMTVQELAEKSGVSTNTISRLENGTDCYSFNAACLAKALGVPMGVYLGYED